MGKFEHRQSGEPDLQGGLVGTPADGLEHDEVLLLAPGLSDFPPPLAMLLSTLPVMDWNERLMNALRSWAAPVDRPAYGAILAVDPFAYWNDMIDLMRRCNVGGVVNFPSISLYGEEMSSGLSGSQLDFENELSRLALFAEEGFDVICMVSTAEQALVAWRILGRRLTAACQVAPADLHLRFDGRIPLVGNSMLTGHRDGDRNAVPLLGLAPGAGITPGS